MWRQKKVSIFERIINYFTGALTQEKNEAMIDYIGTGTLKVLEKDEEGNALLVDLESLTHGVGFHHQLRVFKSVMDGSTGATLDQKNKAVDALVSFIAKQGNLEVAAELGKKAQEYITKHGIEHKALKDLLIKDVPVNNDKIDAAKPLVSEGVSQDLGDDGFFDINLNN